jgi:hypothetical protein
MKELILTFSVFCGGIFAQCGSLGVNPKTHPWDCIGSGMSRASLANVQHIPPMMTVP